MLLLWVVAGVANTLGTVAYETLLQEQTPDHVRGRVFAAVEAAIQAGFLGGVALAALAGESSMATSRARAWRWPASCSSAPRFVSWWLLQSARRRRPAAGATFGVRPGLNLVPAGPSLSLLRVSTEEGAPSTPVLLVDDGARVHRLEALPAGRGDGLAYGVPSALLGLRRTALALEVRGRGLVDIALPG